MTTTIGLIFVSVYIIGILKPIKFIVGVIIGYSTFRRQAEVKFILRIEIDICIAVQVIFVTSDIPIEYGWIVCESMGVIRIFGIVVCVRANSLPVYDNRRYRGELTVASRQTYIFTFLSSARDLLTDR